jgi:hypothetical protein
MTTTLVNRLQNRPSPRLDQSLGRTARVARGIPWTAPGRREPACTDRATLGSDAIASLNEPFVVGSAERSGEPGVIGSNRLRFAARLRVLGPVMASVDVTALAVCVARALGA